jgi:hypothetical protein
MDESFLPLHEIIEQLSSFKGEILDEDNGIHSYIYEFEIDTPVELDILTDEKGKVQIGMIPPLYRVNTTFRPSYHKIKFRAKVSGHK